MNTINQLGHSIGRMALIGTVATMIVAGLAGCGDTTTTTEPTATTGISGDLSTNATKTPEISSLGDPAQAITDTTNPTTSAQAPGAQVDAGANSGAGASTDSSGSTSSATINAVLKEWAIDLSQKEVAAGKVTFSVTNEGRMQHNFTVLDSNGTDIGHTSTFASSEGPQTLEVELKSGTYTVICSLPGHAARGQKAELVVK